jgi:hypothetical protein
LLEIRFFTSSEARKKKMLTFPKKNEKSTCQYFLDVKMKKNTLSTKITTTRKRLEEMEKKHAEMQEKEREEIRQKLVGKWYLGKIGDDQTEVEKKRNELDSFLVVEFERQLFGLPPA